MVSEFIVYNMTSATRRPIGRLLFATKIRNFHKNIVNLVLSGADIFRPFIFVEHQPIGNFHAETGFFIDGQYVRFCERRRVGDRAAPAVGLGCGNYIVATAAKLATVRNGHHPNAVGLPK